MDRDLRIASWAFRGTLVACATGVILGMVQGNWSAVVWAAIALACATTTLVAMERWATWRHLAYTGLHILEGSCLVKGCQDPLEDDGAPFCANHDWDDFARR